jgi:dCMP deaminase
VDPAAQRLLRGATADLRSTTTEPRRAPRAPRRSRETGFDRPSWDEYFLSIARVVASRSNCVKRKVAAVITRDRRIISTGYNGTPRGTRNCNEGGCPRCNAFAEGGTRLDECLCSHGEENAITQAAFHGVSVRGGTLYTTFSPCLTCTKMIINAGIEEVPTTRLPAGRVLALLREAGLCPQISRGLPQGGGW